uniref:Ig-like domain-containing protein n=1 Tax=Pygocentrus nattereri TaxID=42514 RepID=A0AAR2KGA0_PYGNA
MIKEELFICLFIFYLAASLSSVLWQTPGTVWVPVGEAFTLQCIHEMKVQYCYSATSWHKVSKRTGRLNEIRPELNMKQTDTKVCTLTIPNATLQDSGMYHCTGLYNKIVLVGNGTRVIVTGELVSVFHFTHRVYSTLSIQDLKTLFSHQGRKWKAVTYRHASLPNANRMPLLSEENSISVISFLT